MHWILILALWAGPNGGVALHHVEFNSEAACNTAKYEILQTGIVSNNQAVCIEKGTDMSTGELNA